MTDTNLIKIDDKHYLYFDYEFWEEDETWWAKHQNEENPEFFASSLDNLMLAISVWAVPE